MLADIRRYAFTLAEVLVTLGIIGVVSAMTVPSLMQNYQRQSYAVQLHKFYNELSQSLLRYQTERNAVNLSEAGLNSQDAFDELIESTFKVVSKCGEDMTPCLPDINEYKKMNGQSGLGMWTPRTNYVLASGAAISTCYHPKGEFLAEIYIDTNGRKGPNIVGRDFFSVYIYNNGIVDEYYTSAPLTKEQRDKNFNDYCINGDGVRWDGCFGKLLNDNWQMTY